MKIHTLLAGFLVLALVASSFAFAVEDTDPAAQTQAADVVTEQPAQEQAQDTTAPCSNSTADSANGCVPNQNDAPADVSNPCVTNSAASETTNCNTNSASANDPATQTPCDADIAAAAVAASANDVASPCVPTNTNTGNNNGNTQTPTTNPTNGGNDPTPNTHNRNNDDDEELELAEEPVEETVITETQPTTPAIETPVAVNPRNGSVDPVLAPGAFFAEATPVTTPAVVNDTPADNTSPLTGLVSGTTAPIIGIGLLVVLGGLYLYTRK